MKSFVALLMITCACAAQDSTQRFIQQSRADEQHFTDQLNQRRALEDSQRAIISAINQAQQPQPVPDNTPAPQTAPITPMDAGGTAEDQADAARAKAAAKARFNAAAEESRRQAIRHYPQCAVKDSLFGKKMNEIADRLEAQRNPVVYSSDAPFKIAQMAGNELGIAPLP